MKKREIILLLLAVIAIVSFFIPYIRLGNELFEGGDYHLSGFQLLKYLASDYNGRSALAEAWTQLQQTPEAGSPEFVLGIIMMVLLIIQPVIVLLFAIRYLFHAFIPRNRRYLPDLIVGLLLLACNFASIRIVSDKVSDFLPGLYVAPEIGFFLGVGTMLVSIFLVSRRREAHKE
jgi:hypothetical protein